MEDIVDIVFIVFLIIVAGLFFVLTGLALSKDIKKGRENLIKDIMKAIKDKDEKQLDSLRDQESQESGSGDDSFWPKRVDFLSYSNL